MESSWIYLITGFNKLELDDKGWLVTGEQRCFGYYFNLNYAIEACKCNNCDMNEAGVYNYLVIEKVEPGMYPCCIDLYWFKYNGNDSYEMIDKPECTKHICNFSIG